MPCSAGSIDEGRPSDEDVKVGQSRSGRRRCRAAAAGGGAVGVRGRHRGRVPGGHLGVAGNRGVAAGRLRSFTRVGERAVVRGVLRYRPAPGSWLAADVAALAPGRRVRVYVAPGLSGVFSVGGHTVAVGARSVGGGTRTAALHDATAEAVRDLCRWRTRVQLPMLWWASPWLLCMWVLASLLPWRLMAFIRLAAPAFLIAGSVLPWAKVVRVRRPRRRHPVRRDPVPGGPVPATVCGPAADTYAGQCLGLQETTTKQSANEDRRMTIEQGPAPGRQLSPRASDSRRYDTTTPQTRFLAADLWDNGFGLPRAHLERQPVLAQCPTQ